VNALRVLPAVAKGERALDGRLVRSTSPTRSRRAAGFYDGDVAGFIGRALTIVDLAPAAAKRAAPRRLHA